ncbi:hypothetical protein [Kitasatospora mediocidica]|uniref:hypothetical protein n=1 Tax=Kitasatospora mediocidica TaxID=58352 RepID=UPI0006920E68|nr:hypothetical protein [Kitasatospora mediocidica]
MYITKRAGLLTASAAAVLALATACGSSGTSSSPAASTPPPAAASSAPSSTPSHTAADLQVTTNAKLGQIVTDGAGHTLYRFDHDTANPSMSNCTGSCATLWPPALAPSGAVTANGVNASLVGTLTRADGTKQLTLNGWPLYRYSPDTKPGDTNGQGVGGIWFASTPTGGKAMAQAPATPSTAPSTPSSGNGY